MLAACSDVPRDIETINVPVQCALAPLAGVLPSKKRSCIKAAGCQRGYKDLVCGVQPPLRLKRSLWLMQGSLLHEFQCESKLAASSSFPPHEFCMMYVARIGLSWQFFGVILETNLLTSKGSQKTSQLVDCPGKKTAHSPCLLSQVVWTVRVPPRLDLAVFRDSHAGQSWMKHGPRTAPIRFDQKPGQPWSPSPSGPSSWLSENDSSCMQGINCMSHVICPRSRMPITQGDVAIRSLELPR